ncbi:hypothetical protein NEMBOFW57_010300 [Staphylotrichum longicolle]|uniref:Rhodopsin domain-containing protein n=1 Tax=Staphylotrichum longicolle TaxID=669026 RepID=A0AAD4ER97_9PEZI|nr:hypothetical protein NEMBOFW57_010300 [Staphylotrichum longicolle]
MATRNVTNDSDRVFRLPPSTDFGPQINFTIWLLTALSPLSQFNFHNLDTFLLLSNLAGTFSILAALWSKTSFAVTVLRISSGWLKVLVWFIIITVNACLGVAVAITWAQCTPIEKVWQPLLPGECWPKGIQVRYNIFTAIYSGAMDIVLAVVPWKIIWTLTMNRKEKIGVMVAMSMGVFAGVTSIIKITQLPSISNSTFTESTTQLVILAAAESAITIIAASIPILRALIRDSRPPPGPAQFYHSLDFSLYTGAGTPEPESEPESEQEYDLVVVGQGGRDGRDGGVVEDALADALEGQLDRNKIEQAE